MSIIIVYASLDPKRSHSSYCDVLLIYVSNLAAVFFLWDMLAAIEMKISISGHYEVKPPSITMLPN